MRQPRRSSRLAAQAAAHSQSLSNSPAVAPSRSSAAASKGKKKPAPGVPNRDPCFLSSAAASKGKKPAPGAPYIDPYFLSENPRTGRDIEPEFMPHSYTGSSRVNTVPRWRKPGPACSQSETRSTVTHIAPEFMRDSYNVGSGDTRVLRWLKPSDPACTAADYEFMLKLEEKHLHILDKCVALALQKYNEACRHDNDSEYELVEKISLGKFFCLRAVHVNFLAKPRNAPLDAEAQLFFAELTTGGGGERKGGLSRVTRCCILSDKNRARGHCAVCSKSCWFGEVKHPSGGGYAKFVSKKSLKKRLKLKKHLSNADVRRP